MKWNITHVSEVFCRTDEVDPAAKEEIVSERKAKETKFRCGWIPRIWDAMIASSKPVFPDLDDENMSEE